MKKKIALVLLAAMAAGVQAADWSSSSVGYRYAPKSIEKGLDTVRKDIFNFTNVSGDKLGTNFFTIDYLKSASGDPATGTNDPEGAHEYYGFFQRNFSTTKLTGKQQGFGYFKDIHLNLRVDAGSKNTTFGGSPIKFRPGVNFDMPVSAGFWNVGVDIYKEWNQQGGSSSVPAQVTFDTTLALSSAWAIPVGPGTFGGLVGIVGPKGKDQFGSQTETETFIRATYMMGVNGPKSDLKVGAGFDYIRNKFGNNATKCTNGCTGTTPLLLVQYAL
jgi:hypothetical protein